MFDHSLSRITNDVAAVACAKRTSRFVYRNGSTRQHLLAVWDRSGTPSDTNVTAMAQITLTGSAIKEPVWVDLISGRICEFPAERVTRTGDTVVFKDVPVYDAPVLVAEKALVVK
jgi:hypothetical protein